MSRNKLPAGTGMFIWEIDACEGGNVTRIVEKAVAHNLGHLCVKFADGRKQHDNFRRIPGLVAACHSAGIAVWGWPYIYGNDPADEAMVEASWYRELGFDGFIVDAESEYKDRPDAARAYIRSLRAELPDTPIALSSYWSPQYHPEFPWDAFLEHCDFVMPQVYWWGRDPVDTLRRSVRECNKWGLPVFPTGGDFDDAGLTPDELTRFAAEVETLGLPGHNWWHWQGARPDQWAAIVGRSSSSDAVPPTLDTFVPPLSDFARRTVNSSPHGYSIPYPHNTDGHDVIWGHGQKPAVGDALDLATQGPEPFRAIFPGTVTVWAHDATKIEWVYLKSDCGRWLAIYAHVDYMSHDRSRERKGIHFGAGEQMGTVRTDLKWDHLHIELIDLQAGRAITAANPRALQQRMWELFQATGQADADVKVLGPDNEVIDCHPVIEDGSTRVDLRPVAEALGHEANYRRPDAARERIYIKPTSRGTGVSPVHEAVADVAHGRDAHATEPVSP